MRRFTVAALSCVASLPLCLPVSVYAQTSPQASSSEAPPPQGSRQLSGKDNPFGLGEIVVTAAPGAQLVIDTHTISAQAMATFDRNTLDDALNLMPGAYSGSTGGSRNERLIYIRGFNRYQVPMTIDGIRTYLPYDNRLDFGRFLTNDIAEVQVAKGYVSVLDGPDGMGGEVNLVTSKPTKALEAQVAGTLNLGHNGEYGGYNLSGLIGTRHDRWYAQVSVGRNYVDHWDLSGDYVGTPSQPAGRRNFSRSEDWRINAKVGFTPNATDEYTVNYTRQEGAKAAPMSTDAPLSAQRYWTWPAWNMDSIYFLSTTQLDDVATLKTKIYRNRFYNMLRSFDDINENTQTRGSSFNSPYWDSAYGGSARLDLKPIPHDRLSLAVQYRMDQHQEAQLNFPSLFLNPLTTDREATYSLAAENQYDFTPSLSLVAGVGYDWRHLSEAQYYGRPLGIGTGPSAIHEYPMRDSDTWSAQGQLTWTLDAATSLHASISSRARFPTLFERFSQRFGSAIPNPSLKPERATNYEIGGNHIFGPVKLAGAFFYSHIDDAIVSQPILGYSCTASTTPGPCTPLVMSQSINGTTAKYYGVELSFEAKLTPRLTIGGNYTYMHQSSRNLFTVAAPGGAATVAGEPTGVPSDKAFLYADWMPFKRLHLIPSVDIESNRWTVTDAGAVVYFRTGAHENVALRAEYDVTETIHAAIGVRNLLDQDYQLTSGFPEQGRSFYLNFGVKY